MLKGAGILLTTPAGRALFLRRGPGSDHPGQWAFPGGQLEEGEGPAEAAVRETAEECGLKVPVDQLADWVRTIAPRETPAEVEANTADPAGTQDPVAAAAAQAVEAGAAVGPPLGPRPASDPTAAPPPPSDDVDYTTFRAQVEREFLPVLSDEHTAWCWADVSAPPEPLHPGARVALDRGGMDELGVARAIMAGRLTSPQRYENCWLFAMRVTGTGLSYRTAVTEYVWRDPALYMNAEFCARCAGLPVIMAHPKDKATLDTKEFLDRIIGALMFAYLRFGARPQDGEVWAIARVYDESAARAIVEQGLSTSPAVVFREPGVNSRLQMEDGTPFLLEGHPSLLDHLAVVPAGVWDKQGVSEGISIADAAERELVRADAEPAPRRDYSSTLRLLTAKAALIDAQLGSMAARRRRQNSRRS